MTRIPTGPKPFRQRLLVRLLLVPLILLLVYLALFCYYYSAKPVLTRNYTPEFNEAVFAIPKEQRAWPEYRRALAQLEEPLRTWQLEDFRPSSSYWNDIVAYVNRNQDALSALRSAAALPQLGFPLSDHILPEDSVLTSSDTPVSKVENPVLLMVDCSPAYELDRASAYLAADTYLAAQHGNSQLALHNLLAMLAMADHVREIDMAITDQFSWMIALRSLHTIGAVLQEFPSLWSDQDLKDLGARVTSYSDGTIAVRTKGERLKFEDLLQRSFTDNGSGDGRFHMPGYASVYGNEVLWDSILLAPLTAWTNPGRRETRELVSEAMELCESTFAQPLWNSSLDVLHENMSSLLADPRHFMVRLTFPDLATSYRLAEETLQYRDALLAVIAATQYRRKAGKWPNSLTELVPELLAKVPVDRCSGQELRLLLENDNLKLYSLGFDRQDNGGSDPLGTYQGSEVINRLHRKTGSIHWRSASGDPSYPQADWVFWPRNEVNVRDR